MRVLIVYDNISDNAAPDQADALVQARAISAALETLGHEWMTLGVTPDLSAARETITRLGPDVVFNLVESLGGSARLIHAVPAMLDDMGVPYTGASAEAQFITSYKPLAKALLDARRIATPDSMMLADLRETVAIDVIEHIAGDHWIIKSSWEHASIGLGADSVIHTNHCRTMLAELEARLDRLGGDGYVEHYIDGREFNISLLGHGDEVGPGLWMATALPAVEIGFGDPQKWGGRPKIVNYNCKWNEDSFEYQNTQRIVEFSEDDGPLLERLENIAKGCWLAFKLRGYARVDFRIDAKGEPWVLEVNTNPCLSPDAGFAFALERAGIPYADAIDRILKDATPIPAPAR